MSGSRFHLILRCIACGAASAILLTLPMGCKLGPAYRRPAVETPANWRWKIAEPKDTVSRDGWWRIFQDPTLDELQALAAGGNMDLKAAFSRVDQARARARVDRARFYPTLEGNPNFVRYRTSGNAPSPVPFPIPSFTQQQWSVPFDLSYELDLWGKVRRSFEAAQQLAIGAEAARQSMLLTLQADTAAAYFSLQSSQREIDLLERAIALREEALQIFEQRLGAGLSSEFEVQRGRAEVAAARADLQKARRAQAELINGLALLCGQPPAQFTVRIPARESIIPEVAPDLPSALLERRPDIAQAEREMAARMAQIGVAKTAFFPSVRLTASGGVLSGDITDLFEWDSRIWSIGPSVTIPILQGGQGKANLDRAKGAFEESVALYRQRVLVAFKEVEDSLAALSFLKEERQAREQAAAAAEAAAHLSLERYRAGAINFLEVIDSENARLQNDLARVRAANEQLLATVRLIKALGGGWN